MQIRCVNAMPIRCVNLAATLCAGFLALPVGAAEPPMRFDPHAVEVLARMTTAYAHLSTLRETGTWYGRITNAVDPSAPPVTGPSAPPVVDPSAPPAADPTAKPPDASLKPALEVPEKPLNRRTSLLFARPNRLRLENSVGGTAAAPVVYQWVCDGGAFYSYMPDTNRFTKSPVPRPFSDVLRAQQIGGVSLEIVMLTGGDPFKDLGRTAESARMEPAVNIGGQSMDVVAVTNRGVGVSITTRYYVGARDNLLHRMVVDNIPLKEEGAPTPVGDALDELAQALYEQQHGDFKAMPGNDDLPPLEEQTLPVRSTFRIENEISSAAPRGEDFKFTPPSGAMLYQPITAAGSNARSQKDYVKSILKSLRTSRKRRPPTLVAP